MTKLGIIRNPRSRRNRDRGPIDPARLVGDILLREPASYRELETVIEEFAARKIDVIAIDGGDGTIRDVLSAAIGTFDRLPPFALLASGKTNVLAANVGSWGTGEKALAALAAAAQHNLLGRPTQPRPTLRLTFGNQRLYGFVFGAGAYRRTVALADRGLADGLHRGLRVASAIGRSLLAVMRKSERQAWLSGTDMSVALAHEGVAAVTRARFIFLVTTLKRFMFGIWPFWSVDARPLHFLDVDADAPRLASALLPAVLGRPRPWMLQAGYRSGSATRISLRLPESFVLDGEVYSPGPDGTVLIEAGPTVDFIAR